MDLKNGRITVGEAIANPRVRAFVQRRYPMVLGGPIWYQVRNMRLNDAIRYAGRFVPRNQINEVLARLREF